MTSLVAPIATIATSQARREVVSLRFAVTVLVGVCLLLAAHVLTLLASDSGEQAWSVGLSTAGAVGALWSVLGATAGPAANSGSFGLEEMIDASGLGAQGRWAAGLVSRASVGCALVLILMYTTLVLSLLCGSRPVALGPSLVGASSAIASVCVAAAWASLLGIWLSATGAALGAMGLWLAGQAGPTLPWAALTPPLVRVEGLGPAQLLRATLLIGGLVAVAFAALSRRRAGGAV